MLNLFLIAFQSIFSQGSCINNKTWTQCATSPSCYYDAIAGICKLDLCYTDSAFRAKHLNDDTCIWGHYPGEMIMSPCYSTAPGLCYANDRCYYQNASYLGYCPVNSINGFCCQPRKLIANICRGRQLAGIGCNVKLIDPYSPNYCLLLNSTGECVVNPCAVVESCSPDLYCGLGSSGDACGCYPLGLAGSCEKVECENVTASSVEACSEKKCLYLKGSSKCVSECPLNYVPNTTYECVFSCSEFFVVGENGTCIPVECNGRTPRDPLSPLSRCGDGCYSHTLGNGTVKCVNNCSFEVTNTSFLVPDALSACRASVDCNARVPVNTTTFGNTSTYTCGSSEENCYYDEGAGTGRGVCRGSCGSDQVVKLVVDYDGKPIKQCGEKPCSDRQATYYDLGGTMILTCGANCMYTGEDFKCNTTCPGPSGFFNVVTTTNITGYANSSSCEARPCASRTPDSASHCRAYAKEECYEGEDGTCGISCGTTSEPNSFGVCEGTSCSKNVSINGSCPSGCVKYGDTCTTTCPANTVMSVSGNVCEPMACLNRTGLGTGTCALVNDSSDCFYYKPGASSEARCVESCPVNSGPVGTKCQVLPCSSRKPSQCKMFEEDECLLADGKCQAGCAGLFMGVVGGACDLLPCAERKPFENTCQSSPSDPCYVSAASTSQCQANCSPSYYNLSTGRCVLLPCSERKYDSTVSGQPQYNCLSVDCIYLVGSGTTTGGCVERGTIKDCSQILTALQCKIPGFGGLLNCDWNALTSRCYDTSRTDPDCFTNDKGPLGDCTDGGKITNCFRDPNDSDRCKSTCSGGIFGWIGINGTCQLTKDCSLRVPNADKEFRCGDDKCYYAVVNGEAGCFGECPTDDVNSSLYVSRTGVDGECVLRPLCQDRKPYSNDPFFCGGGCVYDEATAPAVPCQNTCQSPSHYAEDVAKGMCTLMDCRLRRLNTSEKDNPCGKTCREKEGACVDWYEDESPSTKSSASRKGIPIWAIVVIVAVCIVLAVVMVLVALLIACIVIKRRKDRNKHARIEEKSSNYSDASSGRDFSDVSGRNYSDESNYSDASGASISSGASDVSGYSYGTGSGGNTSTTGSGSGGSGSSGYPGYRNRGSKYGFGENNTYGSNDATTSTYSDPSGTNTGYPNSRQSVREISDSHASYSDYSGSEYSNSNATGSGYSGSGYSGSGMSGSRHSGSDASGFGSGYAGSSHSVLGKAGNSKGRSCSPVSDASGNSKNPGKKSGNGGSKPSDSANKSSSGYTDSDQAKSFLGRSGKPKSTGSTSGRSHKSKGSYSSTNGYYPYTSDGTEVASIEFSSRTGSLSKNGKASESRSRGGSPASGCSSRSGSQASGRSGSSSARSARKDTKTRGSSTGRSSRKSDLGGSTKTGGSNVTGRRSPTVNSGIESISEGSSETGGDVSPKPSGYNSKFKSLTDKSDKNGKSGKSKKNGNSSSNKSDPYTPDRPILVSIEEVTNPTKGSSLPKHSKASSMTGRGTGTGGSGSTGTSGYNGNGKSKSSGGRSSNRSGGTGSSSESFPSTGGSTNKNGYSSSNGYNTTDQSILVSIEEVTDPTTGNLSKRSKASSRGESGGSTIRMSNLSSRKSKK